MPAEQKDNAVWVASAGLWVLAGSVLLRLLALSTMPLVREEAYYWMYSQHPAPSYLDHPPMVAWTITIGTQVFGNTELGVRIVNNLLMLSASVLMYWFARMWFSKGAALLSALMLQILPVYFLIGVLAMTDGALLFFWLLCLVGISLATKRQQPAGWYLAGLGLGAALLSKYTGVFLGLGALLAVVAHRPWRRHLRSIHPYLAVMLALGIFSPVLIWNARHQWASFRFQFLDRSGQGAILDFLLFQLAVLTPLLLGGAGLLLGRMIKRRRLLTGRWLMVFCFALPLLVAMAFKSLREARLNWTAPAMLSLLPGLCWMFLVQMRRPARAHQFRWGPGVYLTVALCVVLNLVMMFYAIILQPRLQWPPQLGPWRPLARVVQQYVDRLKQETGRDPLVIGSGQYHLASLLAFYRMPWDTRACQLTTSEGFLENIQGSKPWAGLSYRYWMDKDDLRGRDAVYLSDDRKQTQEILPWFDSVQMVEDPRLKLKKQYYLAICRGFKEKSGR